MHDPSTVAFDVKYPWWKYRPWPKSKRRHPDPCADRQFLWSRLDDSEKAERDMAWPDGYRATFITIWHEDPEKDGSDDSCGWSFPKLTNEQRERLWNAAWSEGRDPYFMRRPGKSYKGTRHEAECLYRGLVLLVADVLRIPLTFDAAARMAARSIHAADCCDAAGAFVYQPGYHDNFPEVDHSGEHLSGAAARHRQDRFYGIMAGVARELLRARRPWWRHPKWHFWHWRIQCHPLQQFKRRAFSRCAACGRGFAYGEAVISGSWHGTGPRWFRGEENVYHCACREQPAAVSSEALTA